MAKTLRIKDWDRHFEVAQSRRSERNSWVAIPNKHDGKSYRRLMRLPNGPQLYAAWILILQVASKCVVRGLLADDGVPLSADDLEDKTDCPSAVFEEAIAILTTDKIGWLEWVELDPQTQVDKGVVLPGQPGRLPDRPDLPLGVSAVSLGANASSVRPQGGQHKHNRDNREGKQTLDHQTRCAPSAASATPNGAATKPARPSQRNPDLDALDWEQIKRRANALQSSVPVKTANDRRLLIGACALVESGRLSENWLQGAAESTAAKATGNRAAYFTSALRGRAKDLHGVTNLDALLAAIPIPAEIRL